MSSVYTLKNKDLEVTISSLGAELMSLKKDGREYLWQGDPKFWKDRSPVLFPMVGRMPGDIYRHRGKNYGMNIHGFARTLKFPEVEGKEDALTFTLESTDETLKQYPYSFHLELTYRIDENRIDVTYEVKNPGEETMPFSIGGHPGIHCPLEEGLKKEDYLLEFEAAESTERLENVNGFLTGRTLPLPWEEGPRENPPESRDRAGSRIRLGDMEMPEGQLVAILRGLNSNRVSLIHPESPRRVTMDFTDFPYMGFWPISDAPFLCLEPWQGVPPRADFDGDFAEKDGLLFLEAGEEYRASWSLALC